MTTEQKKVPRGMTELLTAARSKVDWSVHMLGPDEIIPMASYEAAEKYAADLNAYFYSGAAVVPEVLCVAAVVPCFSCESREEHQREALRLASDTSCPDGGVK